MEKLGLEAKVRMEAKYNVSRYNLKQYESKRQQLITHHNVCKKLVEYADKYNYPICYLVYFAVGKNAHRTYVFEDGYKSFDEKKAKTILKWLQLFAKANKNEKLFKNTDLSHALCKYYEKKSKTTVSFKEMLKNYPIGSEIENFKFLEKQFDLCL